MSEVDKLDNVGASESAEASTRRVHGRQQPTTDKLDFEVELQSLIDKLEIKATEVGWEVIGEWQQDLVTIHQRSVNEAVRVEQVKLLERLHSNWMEARGWQEPCAVCMGDATSLEHDALFDAELKRLESQG